MKLQRFILACLLALLILTVGCRAPNGEKAISSDLSSVSVAQSSESSSSASPEISSAQSAVSEAASSKPVSSEKKLLNKTSSAPKVISKKVQSSSEWVAYSNSKDNYKLHIKKKDGTEDKVIINDIVLEPCVAGEWVYYLANLGEIDKVKLDGSQKTRVCSTDALVVYNANVNKYHGLNGSTSITAEYKDGYILYTCFQLKQVEDKKVNPTSYYKLDPNTEKITKIKGK